MIDTLALPALPAPAAAPQVRTAPELRPASADAAPPVDRVELSSRNLSPDDRAALAYEAEATRSIRAAAGRPVAATGPRVRAAAAFERNGPEDHSLESTARRIVTFTLQRLQATGGPDVAPADLATRIDQDVRPALDDALSSTRAILQSLSEQLLELVERIHEIVGQMLEDFVGGGEIGATVPGSRGR